MPNTLAIIITALTQTANHNPKQEIACPNCGQRHQHIKHGFYRRYGFDDKELISIQRYCCLNPNCKRRTFSCLPHPFLPIVRWPLCILFAILDHIENQNKSIAEVARALRRSWAAVYRVINFAKRLRPWMAQQSKTKLWATSPCLDPAGSWTRFVRMVSFAFFPGRF